MKNAGDDIEKIKLLMEQKMVLLEARTELGALTGGRAIF